MTTIDKTVQITLDAKQGDAYIHYLYFRECLLFVAVCMLMALCVWGVRALNKKSPDFFK